jgi:hypothetical protein
MSFVEEREEVEGWQEVLASSLELNTSLELNKSLVLASSLELRASSWPRPNFSSLSVTLLDLQEVSI